MPLQNVGAEQVIQEFINGEFSNKSQSWEKRLHQLFKPFIQFVKARKPHNLSRVSPGDIEDHLNACVTVIAAKTRNEEHRVIKQFFQFALDRQYLAKNPAESVQRRHAEKPPVEILTSRELSLIFKYAPDELRSFLRFCCIPECVMVKLDICGGKTLI